MRLGDLDALKEEVENLVVGGEQSLKDYYKNGSRSDENAWIGGVYDAWELICNATTVEPKLSDEQIEKIADLLETEWGYEGIREDVSRILRGKEE